MDFLENAQLFWRIVEHTLVELYGFEPAAARNAVLGRCGPMTKASITRDVVYHSQPLHVAYHLAQESESIGDDDLRTYDSIVARLSQSGRPAAKSEQFGNEEQPHPGASSTSPQFVATSAR